jgi:hypothetical protein
MLFNLDLFLKSKIALLDDYFQQVGINGVDVDRLTSFKRVD